MFSTWYGKSKYLVRRTQPDKDLRNKAFKIASDPKYDGYQTGLASMVYKFFDKKFKGSGIINESSYQLANELHLNQLLKNLKKENFILYLKTMFWE